MAQSLDTSSAHPAPTRFERRKAEILHAAAGLFNRHGLRDATLAVVASEIGLNLKSLRYYFERKEDLVVAAFSRSIDLHRGLIEEALTEPDFATRLRRLVGSYFALQARVRRKQEPPFIHFGDLRSLAEPQLGIVGAAYVDLFRLTRALFRGDGLGWTPDQRSANAHLLISQLLWSVVWIDGYAPEDYPRVAERLSDILLHGIAAERIDREAGVKAVPTPFGDGDRLSQESFLRAATHLINQFGYRGASVERISALLNVTKGAFYHHNETRDGLVVACFERTFDIVRQAQDLAMAGAEDGLGRLTAATVSLVSRQMLPEGELLRTSALTSIGPELRQEMLRRLQHSTLRFADMLNDGLIDRSVRVCDMRIASETVTATINSAQELQRWVPGATAENATALYIRPLLHGLLAGPSAWSSVRGSA